MPHKVNFVRYADDFVVTAATPELALEAKELIREFLAERGLELSDEKTVVTNIDDGFDFLGWNFRKYNEKLIIKPSPKAVKAIVSNISDTILRRGKAWQQDVLIMKLNEQIRGWTNYHQSVCASDAFAHLDYVLYDFACGDRGRGWQAPEGCLRKWSSTSASQSGLRTWA